MSQLSVSSKLLVYPKNTRARMANHYLKMIKPPICLICQCQKKLDVTKTLTPGAPVFQPIIPSEQPLRLAIPMSLPSIPSIETKRCQVQGTSSICAYGRRSVIVARSKPLLIAGCRIFPKRLDQKFKSSTFRGKEMF